MRGWWVSRQSDGRWCEGGTHRHTYIHTHTCIYIHVHIYTQTYMHIHTHEVTHRHTLRHRHTQTHMQTHRDIYTRRHTQTHAYTHTSGPILQLSHTEGRCHFLSADVTTDLSGLHTEAFTSHGLMGVPSLSMQHRADVQAAASWASRSQRALRPRLPVGSAGSRMMGLGF